MRTICSAVVFAACLAVPAVTRAQPHFPAPTTLAFTSPTQTYDVSGCGSGPLSYLPNAPQVPIFCLTGTATLGVATTAGGSNIYQAVLDFTGTRIGGFDGRFYYNEPYVDLATQYRHTNTGPFADPFGFETPADPTGHWTRAYELFGAVPIDVFQIPVGGVTFGPRGEAVLEYVPADAPGRDIDYARYFRFDLAITEAPATTTTPEPATLALMLGGLAVLGAGEWRRRA